jgi:hypothetical protein
MLSLFGSACRCEQLLILNNNVKPRPSMALTDKYLEDAYE